MTPAPGGAVSLQLTQNPTLGSILTDGQGRTLYLFMKDTKDTSNCYDACATTWPPLISQGQLPTAGNGIKAELVGTAQRKDGTTQITFNGWPLYHYAPDQQPGDTKGQGVGNVWFVISPSGDPIASGGTPAATAAASALTPGSTPSGPTVAATLAGPTAAAATVGPTFPSSGGTNPTVSMKNTAFNPNTLTIRVGTTVTWSNDETSPIPHTVTSGSPNALSGMFDSGDLNPGQTFQFTFNAPGTFQYFCRIHGAAMTGTVTVTQ
jgi:predicted lipoprotein with Yx(FWY)xxD motif/plastocyanin